MKKYKIIKPSTASSQYGGKANNLLLMDQMMLNVPPWVVIPKEVMTGQMHCNSPHNSTTQSLKDLKVPDHLLNDLPLHFGPEYKSLNYAVRSSAAAEDGAYHSFAGQFETKLNVSFHDLENAIKEVWQSVDSNHLKSYRSEHMLSEDLGIAVIIQEMVPSEISGVAFGIDPVSGDADRKVISAVHGLGEGLVSGKLNADNFTISPRGISQGPLNKLGTLNDDQVIEIGDLLDALNDRTGMAQDVEFAYANGQLYVLQTRPITTNIAKEEGEYLVWDNSNIIESYPGITTPMTFSFINKMYTAVYIQLCQLLGVSSKMITENMHIFESTLGLVRGRVYYNLLHWYKMLAMVPGYSLNAEFMETMMGVKETFELDDVYKMSKTKAGFRIVLMLLRMIWLNLTLSKERNKFQNYLNQKLKEYKSHNYETIEIAATIKHYKNYEKTLLEEWKVPLVNDFFSMIWFGLLKKQVEKLLPTEPNIHNDLLCGSKDIISVEPIHRTIALSHLIKSDTEWKQLFIDQPADYIWKLLEDGSHPDLKKPIDRYLEDFGERCMGELKLETTSYTQNPALFIQILKSYVISDFSTTKKTEGLDEKLRIVAEAKIASTLKNRPLKKFWFNIVLKQARALVSNRENLRYERTRAFGIVRKMVSGIGTRLAEQKIIEDSKDIFYLKLEKLLQLESKDLSQLASKIKKTKATFEAYQMQPQPCERFYTHGYDFTDNYIYSEEKMTAITGDLQGIGCCPGQIKARVQIIEDPRSIDSLNGDILVTQSTDPGWVTLFPSASAIIVERGSLLSHSAIVAREMSIPCIVSVDGLLRTVKTGDEVLMDGSSGTIKILNT